jgi:MinD superfamily P-loop ATPase
VMAERCHDCGGCALVCPEKAIDYGERPVGKIYRLNAFDGSFAYGELNVGEFSGVGIVKELKASAGRPESGESVLIDGPPGTGCAAAEAIEDSDYAVLVTEPTPFGVSDMAMVAEMLENTGIPFGVVINKDTGESSEAMAFCEERGFTLLGRIPFDRGLAEASALGRLEWGSPEHDRPFQDLADAVFETAGGTP